MMTISSPSFGHGDWIPQSHTADGADLSPPLAWAGVPTGTKSLALLVEDPDAPDPVAPQRVFTHWIVYNLDPSSTGLPLAGDRESLPPGARQGMNDFGARRYGGPKPPVGRHRYFFRLFALDTHLPENDQMDRRAFLAAIDGHILAETEIVGTYERPVNQVYPGTSP